MSKIKIRNKKTYNYELSVLKDIFKEQKINPETHKNNLTTKDAKQYLENIG